MKTIKKKGQVPRRLPDGAAQEMVKKKGWKFCPKSECRAMELGKVCPISGPCDENHLLLLPPNTAYKSTTK